MKLRIFATDRNSSKRNLELDSDTATGKNKRPSTRKYTEDDDSEFDSEELSDEELDENDMSDDDEVGPAIQEPTMYVKDSGSGADNKCENTLWSDCDQLDGVDVSEAIEEEVFFVYGEGNGHDCDVGNNDIKTTETPASSTSAPQPVVQSKPMFFFGQAGCLKLSPMKPATSSDNSTVSSDSADGDKVESEKLEKEQIESEKASCEKIENENNQESAPSVVKETTTNDTNSVALDTKSESIGGNATTNDETDRGISISNETPSVPPNNVDEKIEQNTSSKDLQISETTKQTETNDSKNITEVEQAAEIAVSEIPAVIASNCDANIDNSKDNTESNSSVALESISVQEESKSIEQESPPIDSELTVVSESHLSNDEIKESEIVENCNDEQSSAPEAQNEVNNVKETDEPEENKSFENSEIVNDMNDLEIENQSSLSDGKEPNAEVEQMNASSIDDVPIENQTLDSSENDENVEASESTIQTNKIGELVTPAENSTNEKAVDASNEPDYSGRVPVVEEIIVPKKSYICGPEEPPTVCTTHDDTATIDAGVPEEEPQTEQIERHDEQPMDSESSTILDEISNNEVKTESPIEQVTNEPDKIDENDVEGSLPAEETCTTEEILSVESHPKNEESQSIPVETSTDLPNQIENTIVEEAIELPAEPPIVKPIAEPVETDLSETTAEIVGTEAPSEENVEQVPYEPVIKPTVHEPQPAKPEPIVGEPIESEPDPTKTIIQAEPTAISHPGSIENITSDSEDIDFSEEQLISPEKSKTPETVEEPTEKPIEQPTEETDKVQIEIKKPEASSAPILEKRKSIDAVAESSECKKVCEENIAIEAQHSNKVDVNLVLEEEKEEIPSIIEQDEFKANELQVNQFEIAQPQDATTIVQEKETIDRVVAETSADILDTTRKSAEPEQSEPIESIIAADSSVSEAVVSPEEKIASHEETVAIDSGSTNQEELNTSQEKVKNDAVEPTIKAAAPKSNDKEPTPPPPAVELPRSTRNRKRRISVEKARHTSESDDNVDAFIESPLSQDASSDGEVGGKRIKMRPKVVKRTLRKSVEQKRNIKDTDWSSDENEKPNAKRATSDLPKETESVKPEKTIPQQDTKPKVKNEKLTGQQEEPVAVEEAKVKEEKDEEPTEQQSDEEKRKFLFCLHRKF